MGSISADQDQRKRKPVDPICVHGQLESPLMFVASFALQCLRDKLLPERHECTEYHCPHKCDEVHRLLLVAGPTWNDQPQLKLCNPFHFVPTKALREAIKKQFGGYSSKVLAEECDDATCKDVSSCSRLHLLPKSLRHMGTAERQAQAKRVTSVQLVDGPLPTHFFHPTMAFLLPLQHGRICSHYVLCPHGFNCCDFHPLQGALVPAGSNASVRGMPVRAFVASLLCRATLIEGAKRFVAETLTPVQPYRDIPIDTLFRASPCLAVDDDDDCMNGCKSWTSLVRGIPLIPDLTKVKYAYHGTKTLAAVRDILCNGLDVTRRAGQAFGPGEYFSSLPAVSIGYANGVRGLVVFALFECPQLKQPDANSKIFVLNNPSNDTRLCLPVGVASFGTADQVEEFFRDLKAIPAACDRPVAASVAA